VQLLAQPSLCGQEQSQTTAMNSLGTHVIYDKVFQSELEKAINGTAAARQLICSPYTPSAPA
jgi:hypothetical protein